ncbi:uncharacterized protein LOC119646727 isoform X2 [Hermetia illucens]|uniref:uncharacterized protein LOC119646727 isoform X2 n=1 Tax=Hermetia illucens TaxID=343691 RepID=UPI0018CC4DBF|nr:uncharacterized protein LOC119646727 isoform X2 [Hermetia illucens]
MKGYLNPGILQCSENSIPHSPPPSYEHVLEENRLAASLENSSMSNPPATEGCTSRMQRLSQNLSIEQISNICTDPDCDIANDSQDDERASHKESLDSTEYLISTMTTPSSHENLLECTGSCDPLCEASSQEDILCDEQRQQQHHYSHEMEQCVEGQSADADEQDTQAFHHHYESEQACNLSDNEENYSDAEWSSSDQYSQQPQQTHLQPEPTTEIISNKSSKKIYKAVAKQWGITCKMSDQCRCMECQSHYFDCEFDDNDHQKTDGGLGAGTPMFISEVMHGTACTIL